MGKGGVGKVAIILALGLVVFVSSAVSAQAQTASGTSLALQTQERTQYGTYDRALVRSVERQSAISGSDVSQSVKFTIEFLSGKRIGQTFTFSKPQSDQDLQILNPQPGDRVVVFSQIDLSNQPKIYFENYDRYPVYFWICILFFLFLGLLGGKAGLKIGLSIGISLVIANYVLLPLGMKDWPVSIVALISFGLIGSSGLLLYMGWNKKSLAALVGMLLGLIATCFVVGLFSAWAHLQTPVNEISRNFFEGFDGLNNIFRLGLLLASFAIIQDICVSIILGIAEIKKLQPNKNRIQLFGTGMGIGRDHLATMALILPLASIGFVLPAIAAQISSGTEWLRLLNMDMVSQAIILPIAALLGTILTIPLCALVGSFAWTYGPKPVSARRSLVWRAPMPEDEGNEA